MPTPNAGASGAGGDGCAATSGDAAADERRLDLRVMSRVRVRLVANMTKLPIDYDMELVDTEEWRAPPAAAAAAASPAPSSST